MLDPAGMAAIVAEPVASEFKVNMPPVASVELPLRVNVPELASENVPVLMVFVPPPLNVRVLNWVPVPAPPAKVCVVPVKFTGVLFVLKSTKLLPSLVSELVKLPLTFKLPVEAVFIPVPEKVILV